MTYTKDSAIRAKRFTEFQKLYKKKSMAKYHLPLEVSNIVNEYAKPIGIRLDWRDQPTPSCLAIYRSHEWRDYRTDVIAGNLIHRNSPQFNIDDYYKIENLYGTGGIIGSFASELELYEHGDEELVIANDKTTWYEWCYFNGILFEYELHHEYEVPGYTLAWACGTADNHGIDVSYNKRCGYWKKYDFEKSAGWNKEKKIGESWWLHNDGTPIGSNVNIWGKWYRDLDVI